MTPIEQYRALLTILYKEIHRFMRIWTQTLIPPAIMIMLYFVIFGTLIGKRIGQMGGFDYMQFMIPGLIMMSVISNSYSNVVSSFFGQKFARSIEELLITPLPHSSIGSLIDSFAHWFVDRFIGRSLMAFHCLIDSLAGSLIDSWLVH